MTTEESQRPSRTRAGAQPLPRRNSLAFIGCLAGALQFEDADRAARRRRWSSRSSSTVPGAPLPSAMRRAQHLDPHRLAVARHFEPCAGKRRQPANMVVHGSAPACSSRCGFRSCRSSPRRSRRSSGCGDDLQRAALQSRRARAPSDRRRRRQAGHAARRRSCRGRSAPRSIMRHAAGIEPLVHLHDA